MTPTQPRHKVFSGRVGMTTVRRYYTIMGEPRAAARRSRSGRPPGESDQSSTVGRMGPRHLAGVPQEHPSHQISLTGTVQLLAVPAHHPGLGDAPTRGLGRQPLKHMSMLRGERVSLAHRKGTPPGSSIGKHTAATREMHQAGQAASYSVMKGTSAGEACMAA